MLRCGGECLAAKIDWTESYMEEKELYRMVAAARMTAEGGREEIQNSVLNEHEILVYINEVPSMKIVCTPTDLLVHIAGSKGPVSGIAAGAAETVQDGKTGAYRFLPGDNPKFLIQN